MPEGFTADEIAEIREDIRVAGGLSGMAFPGRALFANPMFHLFVGYAYADSGEDFFALASFETAEFYAYERNYCNKKIVRELSSIGRYHVITRLEKDKSDSQFFENLTFGTTFSPSGMNIRLFWQAKCLLFSSDIEIVMSDTNYERIYSKSACFDDEASD